MSNARELANFSGVAGDLSRRNLIINGAMQVAQRGTTAISAGNNKYGGPDRFRQQNDSDGATSVSRNTESPEGFGYSLKVDVTSADSSLDADDMYRIQTRFEGQDLQGLKKGTSNAQSLTLSFWVRSPKTGTHIVNLYDSDNTRLIAKSYTVNTADTWEYKTITFAGDTTGAFNNDNALSLSVYWYLCAGTNWGSGTLATDWEAYTKANTAVGQVNCLDDGANNFYLTGVQLEVGDTATPFEHRSYGEELALCQRYYIGSTDSASGYRMFSGITDASYLAISSGFSFPVSMRAAPAVTIYSSADGHVDAYGRGQYGQGNAGATETTIFGVNNVSLQAGGGSATGNAGAIMRGGYRADAEL